MVDASEPDKKDYVDLLEQILVEEKASIDDIIITHWHADHLGGVKDIKKRKLINENCKIWKLPRTDKKEDFQAMGLLELKDKQEFQIDSSNTVKVYFTPGHTTDHAVLFDEQKKVLFSGDCILGEGTAVFEDLYDYMKSLEEILNLKPDVIFPGHGNVVNDAQQKIQYYIAHRLERENQIMTALLNSDKPLTEMGIVEIVYKETPRDLWQAAAVNVHHHLTKLKKEGKVSDLIINGETFYQAVAQSNKL